MLMTRDTFEFEQERPKEYDLVSAIIHRALLDLLSPDQEIARSARRYFDKQNTKHKNFIFKFENACRLLDLNPEMVRDMASDLCTFLENEKPKTADIYPFYNRLKLHSKQRARYTSVSL